MKHLAICLLAWLLPSLPVWAQTPITVHHIGPLTGVLAASNKEALDAVQLYLDIFNAKGGVKGHPVKLELLDDGQDRKKAKALLDELVAGKKLLALMMPRTTPSMEAMLPAIEKEGIPTIGPQTGGSFVYEPVKPAIFPIRASYRKEAERAVALQYSIGVRKFGFLLADDAFGRDTWVGIERQMKELKIEPVATAKIDNRKPDVAEPIKALLAKQPEVVLMIVSAKAASGFVNGYRAAGGHTTFISLSNTSNNDYVKGLGDKPRGPIVMQVMPSPYGGTTALAREYEAAAAAKKMPLSYAGQFGFTVAKLLTLGLLKAGPDVTRASLIAALESLGTVDLGGYRVRYGPGDRTGSNFVDSTIITYGGRFMR